MTYTDSLAVHGSLTYGFATAWMQTDRLLARVASQPAVDCQRPPSAREVEVLRLAARGFTSKQIGVRLAVAEETVNSHIRNVLRVLGARNRANAVAIAYRRGILAFDD